MLMETRHTTMIDVTELRGRVKLGDEVAIIGRQGEEEVMPWPSI